MRTFFPADETARNAFNAMLSTGGACYWMAIVAPNDGSTPMVFGTIPTTTMAGYTIMAGRLIDISDIEQSIDPYKDTFAKTPNVSVEVYNADGVVNQAIMAGSTITVRMGYGATMSIATSEVFFTGKIAEIDRNELHKLKFECTGSLQKFENDIGKIPTNTYDSDSGKIYPIINGEWIDPNSYTPLLRLSKNKSSIIYSFGENSNGSTVPDLYYYNKQTKTGNRLLSTASTELIITDDGKIFPVVGWIPMGVSISAIGNYYTFGISNQLYDKINTSEHSYKILINDEVMAVLYKHGISSNRKIYCLRAVDKTQNAYHENGSRAYVIQVDGEIAQKGFIQVDAENSYAKNLQATAIDGIQSDTLDVLLTGASPRITGLAKIYGTDVNLTIKPIAISYSQVQSNRYKTVTGIKWGQVIDSLGFDDLTIYSAVLNYDIDLSWNSSAGLAENGAKFILQDNDGHVLTKTKLGNGTENIKDSLSLYVDVNGTSIESFLSGLIIEAYIERAPYVEIYAQVYLEATIKKLYLTFNMKVDLLKIETWGRFTGRICPIDGYFNDIKSTLMTNPSSIIEDFCRYSVPSMSYTDLDETAFNAFYTDRTDWKLATAIFTGMK